jgi:hypothetical protein
MIVDFVTPQPAAGNDDIAALGSLLEIAVHVQDEVRGGRGPGAGEVGPVTAMFREMAFALAGTPHRPAMGICPGRS